MHHSITPVRRMRINVYSVLVLWIIALLLLTLIGCSAFTTAVAPKVARAVGDYCLQPRDARMLIREQVRTLAAPNSIQVNCVADAEPTPAP